MGLVDLKRIPGSQNMGGLLNKAYAIPVDHLGALPALSAAGKLKVAANIVVAVGKGFIELYSTPEKNKIEDPTVGEIDGKSKEHNYEFFYPGDDEECDEVEAELLNTPVVILVPDTRGRMRIVGLCRLDKATTVLSADLPAYLIGSNGTSGAARGDLKGKTFQFKAAAPHAPLLYTGALPTLLRDVEP
jgi:hypothetical protein